MTASVEPSAPANVITPQPALRALKAGVLRQAKKRIVDYGKLIWHYQDKLGLHRTRFSTSGLRTRSLAYAKWTLAHRQNLSHRLHAQYKRWMIQQAKTYLAQIRTWSQVLGTDWLDRQLMNGMNIEQRYNQVRKLYANYQRRWNASFLMRAFSCIHRYEGAWNANTGNGYYGGLQMDLPFQSRYGGEFLRKWGTANNWPTWAQFQAAVRAYRSGRGFGPWPNTAHACGLL